MLKKNFYDESSIMYFKYEKDNTYFEIYDLSLNLKDRVNMNYNGVKIIPNINTLKVKNNKIYYLAWNNQEKSSYIYVYDITTKSYETVEEVPFGKLGNRSVVDVYINK